MSYGLDGLEEGLVEFRSSRHGRGMDRYVWKSRRCWRERFDGNDNGFGVNVDVLVAR
jgi:hypothetical protein